MSSFYSPSGASGSAGSSDPVEPAEPALLIACPHCGKPSGSIKSLRSGIVIFVVVAGGGRSWNEVGCPACVRPKLLTTMAINLITANVFWPIVILPWLTIQLLRTTIEGHSPEVLGLLGLAGHSPPARPLRESGPLLYRLLGLGQLGLGMLVAVSSWFVLSKNWFDLELGEQVIAAAVNGLACTLAGYLGYAGLCKLALGAPPFSRKLLLGGLAGVACAALSPVTSRILWYPQEASLAQEAARPEKWAREWGSDKYVREVPAIFWRPEPVSTFVEVRSQNLEGRTAYSFELDQLRNVGAGIARHHAQDPAFKPILAKLRASIEKADVAMNQSTSKDGSSDFTKADLPTLPTPEPRIPFPSDAKDFPFDAKDGFPSDLKETFPSDTKDGFPAPGEFPGDSSFK